MATPHSGLLAGAGLHIVLLMDEDVLAQRPCEHDHHAGIAHTALDPCGITSAYASVSERRRRLLLNSTYRGAVILI